MGRDSVVAGVSGRHHRAQIEALRATEKCILWPSFKPGPMIEVNLAE
jgi:hypothetical protein